MNMSLCQQQKEIKENNLKLKSRTSESAREAESLQIYRRQQQQQKIYTLHHSISSVSASGKKDCKRLLCLMLAHLGGLGLYPFSFKVRGKEKTWNRKKKNKKWWAAPH